LPTGAYPKLTVGIAEPPVILAERLLYINAFESAISTIETQALASKNVVKILRKQMKALESNS
jgi:hypothetical protein